MRGRLRGCGILDDELRLFGPTRIMVLAHISLAS